MTVPYTKTSLGSSGRRPRSVMLGRVSRWPRTIRWPWPRPSAAYCGGSRAIQYAWPGGRRSPRWTPVDASAKCAELPSGLVGSPKTSSQQYATGNGAPRALVRADPSLPADAERVTIGDTTQKRRRPARRAAWREDRRGGPSRQCPGSDTLPTCPPPTASTCVRASCSPCSKATSPTKSYWTISNDWRRTRTSGQR